MAAMTAPGARAAQTLTPLISREENVPAYALPEFLPAAAVQGASPEQLRARWAERREDLRRLFAEHIYGQEPAPVDGAEEAMQIVVHERAEVELGRAGTVWRVQADLVFPPRTGRAAEVRGRVLVYLPRSATGPVPVWLALNFKGNHTVHADPGIRIGKMDTPRGERVNRWPVEEMLARGYGFATMHYGDLVPDDPARVFTHGLGAGWTRPGVERAPDAWAAIGAWAWSLSRVMDLLVTMPEIDAERVAVMGHSRLGRAALWAAARDERFALVVSNNSGAMAAALSRRRFGENVERITAYFPHWFAPRLATYANREDALPVDQHELLALIAPRPVYVASAADDLWADPRGEFLAAQAASQAYRWWGYEGIAATQVYPDLHTPVGDRVVYHVRAGGHDVTAYDWEQFLAFADRHLR